MNPCVGLERGVGWSDHGVKKHRRQRAAALGLILSLLAVLAEGAGGTPEPQPGAVTPEKEREILAKLKEGLRRIRFVPGPIRAGMLADALRGAAAGGSVEGVQLLLRYGALPDADALGEAARHGHVLVANLLLRKGANPRAKDRRGRTALENAWTGNHPGVGRLVLEKKVEIPPEMVVTAFTLERAGWGALFRRHKRQVKGATPAGIAALEAGARDGSYEAVELLLAAGARPTLGVWQGALRHDPRRFSALFDRHALRLQQDQAIELMVAAAKGGEGSLRLATFLLDQGVPPGGRDAQSTPFLHLAVASRQLDVAELLVGRGADPQGRDTKGRTALCALVTEFVQRREDTPSPELVARVLGWGVDPDLADGRGLTPLVHGVRLLRFDLARLLMERGADPNVATATGLTALMALAEADLLNQGFPRNAIKRRQLEMAESLLAHGADPNAQDRAGAGAFERAVRNYDILLVERLLRGGGRPSPFVWQWALGWKCDAGWRRYLARLAEELWLDLAPVPPLDPRAPACWSGLPGPLRDAAQRETVLEIEALSRALFSWYIKEATGPLVGDPSLPGPGPIRAAQLEPFFVPGYLPWISAVDGWGRPLEIRVDLTLDAPLPALVIRSAGRDGIFEPEPYERGGFPAGDLDRDIVWVDGELVRWPVGEE